MESHKILQTVLNATSAELVVYDENDEAILWNQTFLDAYIKDVGRPIAVGETMAEIVRNRLRGRGLLSDVAIEEFVDRRLDFHANPEGSLIFEGIGSDYSMTEHRAENGITVATLIDITPLKTVERALSQSNTELQRSNDDLEQFAYIASHDLKSPLRGIDNLASWIEEDEDSTLSDESRHHAALLRGRVKRLERLLDGVLDYSRAGRLEAEVTVVDTRELCEQIFDYLAAPDGFELQLSEGLPTFKTAGPALETVLRNLIGNAVKHHDRDHGCITVRSSDCGDTYQFTVRDDGPGIESAYHDRVFEIFKTLVPRSKLESSGIGLSIVKRLVESASGTIWVDNSSDGSGAAFHFTWDKQWACTEGEYDRTTGTNFARG